MSDNLKYFKDCKTLDDIKKVRNQLALVHHPDLTGGDEEIMKLINIEYDLSFARLTFNTKTVHKFNLPDGRIVTITALKGKHVQMAIKMFLCDSNDDDILFYLIMATTDIAGQTFDNPNEFKQQPVYIQMLIINNFVTFNHLKK